MLIFNFFIYILFELHHASTSQSYSWEPTVRQLHASSPMTKAPASTDAPVAIEIKAWDARPAFDKQGRSGAGGHCSTNHASSEMTKASTHSES
ncbi:hypothetical protein AB7W30_26510 [Providencia manganoxydans]